MQHHQQVMKDAVHNLAAHFKAQLLFVGLQGGDVLGEDAEAAELDLMIVLDTLTAQDVEACRGILRALPGGTSAHGFTVSRAALAHWPAHEIFQLAHDTQGYYSSLEPYLPAYTEADIRQGVCTNISALYHMAVHTLLAGDDMERDVVLFDLYQSFFFAMQGVYYLRTGEFLPTRAALVEVLEGDEKAMMLLSTEPDMLEEAAKRNSSYLYNRMIQRCQAFLEELAA